MAVSTRAWFCRAGSGREGRARKQEISPAAQAEREDSVDAFSDLGTAAVTNLITDVFAEPPQGSDEFAHRSSSEF